MLSALNWGIGLAADDNWHSPEPIPESVLTGSRTTTTANPAQQGHACATTNDAGLHKTDTASLKTGAIADAHRGRAHCRPLGRVLF